MGYYIDLKNISLDAYKEILKSADLLPSRMVLKENIDAIFDAIHTQKIENREIYKRHIGVHDMKRSRHRVHRHEHKKHLFPALLVCTLLAICHAHFSKTGLQKRSL
jgi:hypothetical protein